MKKLFKKINQEIELSNSKFKYLKKGSLQAATARMNAFNPEFNRLYALIPKLVKEFVASNDMNESQIKDLKHFIDSSMTKFITESGVPEINTDFKLDIDSYFLKS